MLCNTQKEILLAAVKGHDMDTLASLLKSGIEFEHDPLHLASVAGHTDIITLLLDHGAKICGENSVSS